ncbi:potassium-transporting ATPase subunit KdpB [Methanoculleus sp. UBA303]|jgi:K+-transporting ATPase ATPase B chain|uniref:potassium-transporting ATPase subunit KdpB n=1 Tax=Methanoculleus sp. UBA303 TaxID=1915497 RepID=UPI0025D4CC28|nr:potassium-transporting ATPase subunit KdpB [Methanoculleus sp. UBA303]MDD3932778.1 potassium-transporting ATPase subunit KdpB [Methanoculleus sp.]
MARKRYPRIAAFEPDLIRGALIGAMLRLDPRKLVGNPVMLLVEIGGIITTLIALAGLAAPTAGGVFFPGMVSLWLWLTVLFANFAESLSEGRGKARAASLRESRGGVPAHKLREEAFGAPTVEVPSSDLRPGDLVLVRTGEVVPGDGEVVKGAALVNEAAITGESAPVVRESGGDRSAVTGGTTVIANEIIVRITAEPGQTFLDRMIAMVEGAERRKTPNEVALDILLLSLTAVFLLAVANIYPASAYSAAASGTGAPVGLVVLVALFVCLAPTTIAALLPAIGIAGMDRLFQHNVVALSGRAIEAAGDVNVLLLDKTGTITLGNRQATEFVPVEGQARADLMEAALLSSAADETPEGRSIVALVREKTGTTITCPPGTKFIPFSAATRVSGAECHGTTYLKGATDAIVKAVRDRSGAPPPDLAAKVTGIASAGGTPLVVARGPTILGVIFLKDILKTGIRERFSDLRRIGIRTVMITGDNPLTAAAIAAEAGVDDYLAEAKPDDKLRLIRGYQDEGYMVAMTGDGTNDAPALAQADVAVAMNSGTQPAREAANIIDLDSDPTKLLDIVEVGKEILMTRGALTTFSIANDIAKYFAIIPAALAGVYPRLAVLNIMGLATPGSAILSAVIFNALVIPLLIPLALAGVRFRPMPASQLFAYNLTIFGLGGVVAPFIGIKVIDLVISGILPI